MRKLIAVGATVLAAAVAAALVLIGLALKGPPPISPTVATKLLQSKAEFRNGRGGKSREIVAVARIFRRSPSERNSYLVEFVWRWSPDSAGSDRRVFKTFALFVHRDGVWVLTHFEDENHELMNLGGMLSGSRGQPAYLLVFGRQLSAPVPLSAVRFLKQQGPAVGDQSRGRHD